MAYEIINREQVEEDLFEGAFYYAQISLELHYIINEDKKQIVVLAIIFGKKGDLDFRERI